MCAGVYTGIVCAMFGQSVTEGRCVTLGVGPSNLNVPCLVNLSQKEDVSH